MHRFYLPPGQCEGTSLLLSGSEAHHGLHVLRIRRGETVTVLDGKGLTLRCSVEETERDQVRLKVVEKCQAPPLPCQITLAQAIPKGRLFESIIQKATELSAARIVPLITERTVVRVEPPDVDDKVARWQQVAVEAIKQCGSPWLPTINSPRSIEKFVSESPRAELALVGSLRSDARHPRTCFEAFERAQGRKPGSVSIAIGPEGDFTDQELSLLQSAAAQPITLGPLVLRTDTAAVYCLSVINYELQFEPPWMMRKTSDGNATR